ncbi:MAG TPA: serine/threonine-protein kinase, partial [Rudaea sp.]
MTDELDWQRVRALYMLALEQPADEREAWLQRAGRAEPAPVAEVQRLLHAPQPGGIETGDALDLLTSLLPDCVEDPAAGSRNFGPYRLIRQLGAGGMGRVFLAERADGQFQQRVALKIVREEFASPELRARFMRERDILARLGHPNIAQLHDGGVSADAVPYFTLEYIDGEPITQWCDERRRNVRARVQLLLKVCDAVEHAHRNLVIHRDLKPSNILVTADGEPKLLDFGIAKPLDAVPGEHTATAAQPMTPEYAAPEQALGDPVTTATDVYALGVVLYRLLSGRTPYRSRLNKDRGWIKAVLEENPEPLTQAVARTDIPSESPPSGDSHPSAQAIAEARDTSVAALRRSLRG